MTKIFEDNERLYILLISAVDEIYALRYFVSRLLRFSDFDHDDLTNSDLGEKTLKKIAEAIFEVSDETLNELKRSKEEILDDFKKNWDRKPYIVTENMTATEINIRETEVKEYLQQKSLDVINGENPRINKVVMSMLDKFEEGLKLEEFVRDSSVEFQGWFRSTKDIVEALKEFSKITEKSMKLPYSVLGKSKGGRTMDIKKARIEDAIEEIERLRRENEELEEAMTRAKARGDKTVFFRGGTYLVDDEKIKNLSSDPTLKWPLE